MERRPLSVNLIRSALLALLLAAAQAIALGHEIGHGAGAEAHNCDVCPISGGVKSLAAAPEFSFWDVAPPPPFTGDEATLPPIRRAPGPGARGPPIHS